MHVEIQRCTDVGVAEKNADSLVVAFTLNAARCEAVPEAVETHLGKSELLLEFIKVAAVCTGFGWCGCVGKDIEVPSDNLLQWTDQGQQIPRHGDVPDGVLGFGFVHDELGVFLLPVHQVDALDSLGNSYNPSGRRHTRG